MTEISISKRITKIVILNAMKIFTKHVFFTLKSVTFIEINMIITSICRINSKTKCYFIISINIKLLILSTMFEQSLTILNDVVNV